MLADNNCNISLLQGNISCNCLHISDFFNIPFICYCHTQHLHPPRVLVCRHAIASDCSDCSWVINNYLHSYRYNLSGNLVAWLWSSWDYITGRCAHWCLLSAKQIPDTSTMGLGPGNTWSPGKCGWHFADDIFKCIFVKGNCLIKWH